MKKRILAVMVITVLVLSVIGLVACGGEEAPAEKVYGFDIDLAREIFKGTGVEIECKQINWDSKTLDLNGGKIDLVWNGLTINDERLDTMQISDKYLMNEQAIVVKSDKKDSVKKVADLVGKKIVVEKGSAGQDAAAALKKAVAEIPDAKAVDAQITALTEVKSGTSNVAIIDATMAGYLINKKDSQFSDLAIANVSDANFEKEYYGVAAKKGKTKLIAFINEGLKKAKASGKYAEIAKTYGLTDRTKGITFNGATVPEDWKSELNNEGKIVIGYTINAPMGIKD